MTLNVYAPMGNEEDRLPWFLHHYLSVVRADRIFLYANHSTDNSVAIARKHPEVTVIDWVTPDYDDQYLLDLKNNCWKEHESDWAIVCDIDEHLRHPDWYWLLTLFRGDSLYALLKPSSGWEMVTDYDISDYRAATHGFQSPGHCKPCLFQPKLLNDTNYLPGCHYSNARLADGSPLEPRVVRNLQMRHYQCVGINRVLKRYHARAAILSERNKRNGWGGQYLQTEEETRAYFGRECMEVPE